MLETEILTSKLLKQRSFSLPDCLNLTKDLTNLPIFLAGRFLSFCIGKAIDLVVSKLCAYIFIRNPEAGSLHSSFHNSLLSNKNGCSEQDNYSLRYKS